MNVKDIVIDKNIANIIFAIEEENCSPMETIDESEYQSFLSDYIGKTVEYYCYNRWPEEPNTLLEIVTEKLGESDC